MYLPSSSSPLSVKPTEEDAHCSTNFIKNLGTGKKLFTGRTFEEEGIQFYYENFRIEIVSSSTIFLFITALAIFIHGLAITFIEYDTSSWLMRTAMIIRCIILIVALYVVYKIFYSRIRPESSTHEEFHLYVSSVVRLSNLIVISFALVNGFVCAWKSSLGSCLVIEDNQASIDNDDYYFLNCNTSYEIGSTPTEAMLLLLVGNILVIVTLRCHSYWAAWVSYIATIMFVIAGAALSPSPTQSIPAILLALLSILIYVSMENNTVMMFTALLELSSTSRVKTAELKQFVGNVAHDLKTPLHGFTMCMDHVLLDTTEHMADGKEKDDIIEQLQMCKTNCAFMSVAINRTVDFAKSTSDIALTPKMEPVSITDSMQWAVTCLKAFQPNVSIAVVPLPAGICDMIVTDKHWLMENVLCYLSNAVKYSASGHVTVSASLQDASNLSSVNFRIVDVDSMQSGRRNTSFRSLEIHPESGVMRQIACPCRGDDDEDNYVSTSPPCQMLCISVEDEGIGISDDKKSSLFKPFQQTMRLAGGTGLGLYSLSKRVAALKGSFGVVDRTDGQQGSQFWFSIPYSPDESADSVSMILKQSESGSISHSIDNNSARRCASPVAAFLPNCESSDEAVSSPAALVVDDSVVICKSTMRMLEKAGYDVDVAENGAIGLEKMKVKVYSVVIMDLQMPVMDGLEATRRMRLLEGEKSFQASGKRQQYIIGASANGADDVMRDALVSGMNMFVEKPFSMSMLAQYQQDAMLKV